MWWVWCVVVSDITVAEVLHMKEREKEVEVWLVVVVIYSNI